jgi:catechol 2,3-dioxygenase-like lactoylglutathione lyase family enzyme
MNFEAMTFDHAGLSVGNIEVSRRFYAEILGFTIVEESFELPEHDIRGLVIVNGSGVRIELFERAGSRPNRKGHPADDTLIRGWFQLALAVDDVRAVYRRVVEAGAKPLLSPRIAPDGRSLVAFIGDPDDNLVEFLQRADRPA